MLRETVQYANFDGVNTTETLYFNLTKTELMDHIYIQDEVERVQRLFEEERELSRPEVQSILDLVKKFMKLSYGERSEDGKRFIKNERVWEEFTQTAAYDSFLFSLFENPEKAFSFIVGVMPADLREAAEREVAQQSQVASIPTAPAVAPPVVSVQDASTTEVTLTSEPKSDELSDEELLKLKPQDMSREQMLRAFQLKSQQ